ncbi:MAG: hypothetical protein FWF22_07555 [Treponema sp.]|nr:hypothetical protein [Treponema sp.]
MDRAILMDYLVEEAEDRLEYMLKSQFGGDGPYNGAVPEPDRLCPPFPRNLSTRLLEMIALWINPASRFYAAPEIPDVMKKGLAYLRREQRPSGNIDLWDCNFDSAPDSGFFIWDLLPLYRLLEKPRIALPVGKVLPEPVEKSCGIFASEVKAMILKVLEGLRTGGFHTANHRWVMSSSLVAGYKLTGNQAYLDRAKQYLAEGIDCSEDGEYSERSAIYNAVNNQAMILLFEELGDEKYLGYVRRNLHLMTYFFEADNSLFTGNSTRQDRGKKMFAGRYLYQYLYVAHFLKDEEAAGMAMNIAADFIRNRRQPGPDSYPFMVLHPEIVFPKTSGAAFRISDYNRYFKSSGLVRYKKNGFGFSLLHDDPAWLFFNAGSLNVYCKTSLGYFNQGNVKIESLETIGDGYHFSFHATGFYFEPLENPAGNLINFRSEDHSARKKQNPNHTDLEITVRPNKNGIDLDFAASGINGVHYCFEFVLPAGISVSADHFALLPKPGDYILMKDGSATVRDNTSGLRISGAFADTELFATSRNSQARSAEGFTIYMNGTAPFTRTVSIGSV